MSKEKYTGPKVTDTKTFIQKARWAHGDKYRYSRVDYVNSSTKVEIMCYQHGSFWQTPGNHLANRRGCPECGLEKSRNARLKDTSWFIEKSKAAHGCKYDYSKSIYRGVFEKVCIVCHEHGSFYQSAKSHFDGNGCPTCSKYSRPWKRGADYYIERAKEIHCDKYDYSKVLYKGVKEKVEIICPSHGSFWQNFDNHVNTQRGCPKCAKSGVSFDTKEFIRRAREAHGDKYVYEKTYYLKADAKVLITCPEHGDFEQIPAVHLRGSGCSLCAGRFYRTKNDFINDAVKIHSNKYDYSKVKYEGVDSPVIIGCPEHGDFEKTPYSHLNGSGCNTCSLISRGLKSRSTTEEFIQKAGAVHGNKYNYDESNYVTNSTKVKIVCGSGHAFYQTPANHLTGFGCPECALENSGWGKSGFYGTDEQSNLYVLKINNQFIKVGLAKKIHRRMSMINKESGYSVEKLHSISGKANEIFDLEQVILRHSGLERYYPETPFGGQSECLELSELAKVLEIIQEWVDNQPEDCYIGDDQTL